ncbi:MAG: nuclear transport factor 2 family protein [Chloroflexi bacterium]|jgi:ketosteroid isomerase-like protein|nr:nuclear transport factor 2 family protein [Chloroflexota bacterium]
MLDHTTVQTEATLDTIYRFNEAFNRQDVPAVMALMTDDCLFEGTYPAPDGQYYRGQAQVQDYWNELFNSNLQTHFDAEEIFASGDRCVVRWIYHWVSKDGNPGHVRGIDLCKVRDGKVAEKFSYVKG